MQKLERPATLGVSAETPILIFRGFYMAQAFLDYDGQVDKLITEKELI
ncbi:MAG: hypothetical protein ACI4IS_07690 [Acutalibacteraceae bacterium]